MPGFAPARTVLAVLPALVALVVAGCGGGDGTTGTTTATASSPDPAGVAVVRRWADTLRRGDVAGAARFFAVPAVVANGGPPIRLLTRPEVRFFNETLPCGAQVVSARRARAGFLVVTFALTERPGSGTCGAGTGRFARTAIRVRRGLITDWVRVQDLPTGPSRTV